MIVVTGATGQLGARIVEHLLDRVPAGSIGVSVRDVGKATGLAARGVRVRAGDFTDPPSLTHAFEGADQVLVVSPMIRGAGASQATGAAIDAAVAAGATRVLYTSHQMASPYSWFAPARTHAVAERRLAARCAERGAGFTALRHGFYASTFEYFVPAALASGELLLPADGPVSWTAHADLAAADAAVLSEPGALQGVTPPLAGSEVLDFADVARILSDLTGRAIKRVVVDDEEWKSGAVERGMPEPAAEFTLGMFRASRAGENAVTDPALETLLGRAPISVKTVLEQILDRSRAA